MYKGGPDKKIYIDEGLFEKIQHGDRDAFHELYDITYRAVYAFLFSYVQNREDAKDLLQDTYVQIFKNINQYRSSGSPMAWIMKIAKNVFLMNYRKEHGKQSLSYEEMENEIGFDHIENTNTRIILEKIFSVLSPEDRAIIIMHDIDGLKFKEIAEVLEKPIGTVLARYSRNIKKLQKEFNRRCE